MKPLWLLGLCAAGYLTAEAAGVVMRPNSVAFEYGTRVLLAVGLYGAIAGIRLDELRASRNLAVKAVTAGVVAKWLLIGGLFWLYFRHPCAFVLGLAVTQIDPLSVAHLLGDSRHPLSARGGRSSGPGPHSTTP
jgi:NhaP-type Na+/H+ or K+/H+ antiporter